METYPVLSKQEAITNTATQCGGAVSMLSGIWMWLGANHDTIASLGILIGACVGLGGLYLNKLFKDKHHELEKLRVELREREVEVQEQNAKIRRRTTIANIEDAGNK